MMWNENACVLHYVVYVEQYKNGIDSLWWLRYCVVRTVRFVVCVALVLR